MGCYGCSEGSSQCLAKITPSNSSQTVLSATEEQPCQVYDYPTVLVACEDDGLGGSLVNYLQQNGFHVLERSEGASYRRENEEH